MDVHVHPDTPMLRHIKTFIYIPLLQKNRKNKSKTMSRQLHRGGALGADMLGLSEMTIYKGRAGGLMSGFQG